MEKLINETLSFFEWKERDNKEKFIILKSEAPDALRNSVMDAHGDRLANDWIYNQYYSILETLSNYTIENTDDIDGNRAEIVDGLVDCYTSELTEWLNSDNRNVYYMTEAQEEYGAQTDGFKLLAMAQYKAIDEIFSEVASYLNMVNDNTKND